MYSIEIERKALAILSKGRDITSYMSSLSLAERLTAMYVLRSYSEELGKALPFELITGLVAYPEQLAKTASNETLEYLDRIGKTCKEFLELLIKRDYAENARWN